MSDTGGGHRSVSEALAAAFAHAFPNRYDVRVMDAIKECAAFPFNQMPGWYLPIVNFSARVYGWMFHLSNTRALTRVALELTHLFGARGFRRLFRAHAYDLVISAHPLLLTIPRRILRECQPHARFVTVVADLVNAHRTWFDPDVDACFVPTPVTRDKARRYRVPNEKLFLAGLPVSLKLLDDADAPLDKRAWRARLGLEPERAMILLVGGGEGMGPVYAIARALARARVPVQLVVIAGRNKKLRDQLARVEWEIPVSVQGFVTNMPDWMRAADAIITKAGPTTINEALACGLPIILSGYLPGQETGNVNFVVGNGVGVYCPSPAEIVATVREWLTPGNATLAQFAARARAVAKPDAALEIVRQLDEMLNAEKSVIHNS